MTINSETRVAGPYEGNDSTVTFPFAFKVFDSDELLVVRAANAEETELVLGADYSVALNPDQNASPGGSVTLTAPLASLSTLTLTSDLEYLQPLDLTNQGGFYPRVINNAFDRVTILLQQLKAIANRTLKFPLSDGPVGDLPGRAERAGAVLAFDNATGEPIAGPSIDQLGTVAAGLEAIGTVASNIADVNTVADNVADITNFADVYYGPNAIDPTTRKDATPLQSGDLYFNTELNELRVYDGAQWRNSVSGTVTVQNLSGDGVTTEFLLNYAPDSEIITQIYIHGVYQQKNTYELGGVGGSTLIFDEAPPAGVDNIEVVVSSLAPSEARLREDLANGTNYLVDANVVGLGGQSLPDLLGTLATKSGGPVYFASRNGVNVTGSVDATAALNALLLSVPSGSTVVIDGTVRTSSPIIIPKEGITLRGLNRRGCAIRSYGTGAIIQSATQDTVTCKFTVVSDLLLLRDATATGSGYLLDLKSMQFSTCERLWIVGAGVAGQIGVRMEAQATAAHIAAGVATEGSYNYLRDCVIGGVTDCVSIRNIANSNTLENVRCQPSITGGYGIRIVADVAAGAYVNNIRIISCACEYPGKITSGVYVGANVSGVTILGTRFESMNIGVYVDPAAGDVWVPLRGNYFSSCNTDVRNEGGDTHKGSVALLRFSVVSGSVTIVRKSGIESVTRSAVGVYSVTFSRGLGTDYVPNVTSSNPQTEVVSLASKTLLIRTYNSAGAPTDATFVMLMVEA